MEKTKIVIICGPTASGKSGLAVELAVEFGAEIISADSMQVYRRMDIGTAKPSRAMRELVPHHLIDIVDPDEDYTAASFMRDARDKVGEVRSRGRLPLVAGGTGLYLRALTDGLFKGPASDRALRSSLMNEAVERGKEALHERLRSIDPASAAAIHPNNLSRVVRAIEVYELTGVPISLCHGAHAFSDSLFDVLKIGIESARDGLYGMIDSRVDAMMEAGLLEETEGLIKMGYSPSLKPMCALGYKEMAGLINGEYGIEEAVSLIKRNTRRYAKRQLTWFRKDADIRWFSLERKKDIIAVIEGFMD